MEEDDEHNFLDTDEAASVVSTPTARIDFASQNGAVQQLRAAYGNKSRGKVKKRDPATPYPDWPPVCPEFENGSRMRTRRAQFYHLAHQMATEDGCHWVVLGLSKNNMRYSTQNKEAGNLALEITKTLEYRALIKKMTEMVNDEQKIRAATPEWQAENDKRNKGANQKREQNKLKQAAKTNEEVTTAADQARQVGNLSGKSTDLDLDGSTADDRNGTGMDHPTPPPSLSSTTNSRPPSAVESTTDTEAYTMDETVSPNNSHASEMDPLVNSEKSQSASTFEIANNVSGSLMTSLSASPSFTSSLLLPSPKSVRAPFPASPPSFTSSLPPPTCQSVQTRVPTSSPSPRLSRPSPTLQSVQMASQVGVSSASRESTLPFLARTTSANKRPTVNDPGPTPMGLQSTSTASLLPPAFLVETSSMVGPSTASRTLTSVSRNRGQKNLSQANTAVPPPVTANKAAVSAEPADVSNNWEVYMKAESGIRFLKTYPHFDISYIGSGKTLKIPVPGCVKNQFCTVDEVVKTGSKLVSWG